MENGHERWESVDKIARKTSELLDVGVGFSAPYVSKKKIFGWVSHSYPINIFYDNLENKKQKTWRNNLSLFYFRMFERTVQKVETLNHVIFLADVFIELCISIHIWWCYHPMLRQKNAAPHPCRRRDRRLQWHLNHGRWVMKKNAWGITGGFHGV